MAITDVNGKHWIDHGGPDHQFKAVNLNKLRPGGLIHQTPGQLLQITAAQKLWLPIGVPLDFPGATLAIPAGPGTVWVYLDSLEVGAAQLKQSATTPTGNVFICARVTTDGSQITAIENILVDRSIPTATDLSVVEQLSTGRVEFDGLSRVAGLTIQFGAGRGYIKSGPPPQSAPATIVPVSWPATNVVLADDAVSYLYVDAAGTPTASSVFPDPEQTIIVGVARTSAGSIPFLSYFDIDLIQKVSDGFKYLRDVVGPALSGGLLVDIYSPPSLQIELASGTYYIAQDRKDIAAIPGPATFTYWYRDGIGGWVSVPGQTSVDDGFYDDGSGTLAALPAGKFKGDLVVVAAVSSTAGEIHVIYGQQVFDTHAEADNLIAPTPPGEFSDFAIKVALLDMEQGAGQIEDVHDIRPRFGGMGVAGSPVTDHGLLGGLGDDDHTQYQLRSEKGAIGGYAGLDGSALIPQVNVPPPQKYFGSSVTPLTSGVTTYTDLPALTLTPTPGTYFYSLTIDADASANNVGLFIGVGLSTSPGTVLADSERLNGFSTSSNRASVPTSGIIVVGSGESVVARFKRFGGPGGSTVTLRGRGLTLVRVSA